MPDVAAPAAVRRKPPRAAYVLPTLFTAGNIFLGFLAILRCIQGSIETGLRHSEASGHFSAAAQMIGAAMLLDGLDGRVARLTNTTSDFGREMDSMSDVISFGIAPALLAWCWGVQFLDVGSAPGAVQDHILRAGKLITFLFLLCGAARLARFNVQKNPKPSNPGRPNRKYFVGLPIPAAAALIASVVYATDGYPLTWWPLPLAWLALLMGLSFLMVSTWRYYAFKDNAFLRPRSPLTIILVGALIFAIANWSQLALFVMAAAYVSSGVVLRVGGLARRLARRHATPSLEHPVV